MTVRELIARLSTCNQDAIVLIDRDDVWPPEPPTVSERRALYSRHPADVAHGTEFWIERPYRSVEAELKERHDQGVSHNQNELNPEVIPAVVLA